jgi:transposase-like protein
MKRGRFSEEQIIAIPREHEVGGKAAELARKHGISEATRKARRRAESVSIARNTHMTNTAVRSPN